MQVKKMTEFNHQIEDITDAPNAGVDTAHRLQVKCFKGREHYVVVGCIVACLAKDLGRRFRYE
jgi:hypothetical protein